MAAKVLLGVVALAAIVGSPIAYNHLSSSSGETQKEEAKPKNEQANVAQPSADLQKPEDSNPADRVPEASEGRQDTNEQSPLPEEKAPAAREETQEKSKDGSEALAVPKKDDCKLEGTEKWNELGSLDPRMHCVRDKIKESRESR